MDKNDSLSVSASPDAFYRVAEKRVTLSPDVWTLKRPNALGFSGVWTFRDRLWYDYRQDYYLSTPIMTTCQPTIRETSSNDADIIYVTDNVRDAEVLQHQTEKPVRILPPATETVVCGFTEIRIRKQLFSRDARNVLDV